MRTFDFFLTNIRRKRDGIVVERMATSKRISPITKIRNVIFLVVLMWEDEYREVDTIVDVDTDTDTSAMQGSSKPPCFFGNHVKSTKKKTIQPTLKRCWQTILMLKKKT